MAQRRRMVRSLASLLVASLLTTVGCSSGDDDGPSVEFASTTETWWPLRGNLAEDTRVRAEVAQLAAQWQTPKGVGIDAQHTRVFWLGELDGTVLGLVGFYSKDRSWAPWLLEVSGQRGELAVTSARFHPGWWYDQQVLAVRSPEVGPRYLVSAEVTTLEVQGKPVSVAADGMTGRTPVPECRATLLVTQQPDYELQHLDLGLGVAEPFYPLVGARVESSELLAEVDTCQAMTVDGWMSADGLEERSSGEFDELLHVAALKVSAPIVNEPEELPGQLSEVHASCLEFPSGIKAIARLVWTYPPGAIEPGAVTGAEVIVDASGLLVLKIKEMSIEIDYRMDGEQRTVTVIPSF